MDFLAIDFETANLNQSPCSLGLTIVEKDNVIDCKSFLINPKEPFATSCTKINGITPKDVVDSPEFPAVWENIKPLFMKYPIVAHNISFDYDVLKKALLKYNLQIPKMKLYCTFQLARKNYPEIQHFNLPALCEYFDISLENHHACECDSLACALLLIKMSQSPTFELTQYIPNSSKNTSQQRRNAFKSLFKEPEYDEAQVEYDDMWTLTFDQRSFVITGDIEGYSRDDLIKLIEDRGGTCKTSVSKKVDYLIVGMQNTKVVKDKADAKSEKIMKAEKLRDEGFPIKIISDEDFMQILHQSGKSNSFEKDWFEFYDESEKIKKLKAWGLLSRTATECKQLYYCGINSNGVLSKCEVIGYVNSNVAVISITNKPYKIHADYLKEMQPTKKEVEQLNAKYR
ncbi:exonuclease domain-containing protein [Caproiciproducens galactitolivorans]|uniref:Exonuclease domain-containing protein n=1 Tax=Caproiciproducens galactitolivorans TaxID=642589 RepID=A0ABT4BVC6_9FIRM|nr:exonuclease domain-containing protein [Caproiciproducens galactitolivorans]MCY1714842.1 exonuclease domain-containing protein [Caproiciproducens galactitolivorans]